MLFIYIELCILYTIHALYIIFIIYTLVTYVCVCVTYQIVSFSKQKSVFSISVLTTQVPVSALKKPGTLPL